MIKKPFSFGFSNRVWQVKYVKEIDGEPDTLGLTETGPAVITLRKDLDGRMLISTLYHELSHVILSVCEDSIPNAEELICNLMAEGLTTIIPQLPKFFR